MYLFGSFRLTMYLFVFTKLLRKNYSYYLTFPLLTPAEMPVFQYNL